jgi:heme A synthase
VTASPWPRRLALSTLLAAVPLVLFGGTVTTLHAGLAIDGWLVLEPGRGDHFLWLYPVDKWFRDVGTFVEHSHRLFGSVVGLLAIATVIAAFASGNPRRTRVLSVAALLAVVAQGDRRLRVLERARTSPSCTVRSHRPCSRSSARARGLGDPGSPVVEGSGSRRLAWFGGAVYLQIVAGAWLRHDGSVPPRRPRVPCSPGRLLARSDLPQLAEVRPASVAGSSDPRSQVALRVRRVRRRPALRGTGR